MSVDLKPRPVTCHAIQCTDFSPPSFTLEVHSGGGFYVRSLVHDLGNGKYSNCKISRGYAAAVFKMSYFLVISS